MRIFVTGATGFIGSALTNELITAGHQVIGMTRSDEGARSLAATGATVHRGTLEDLDSIRDGAMKADGVIHTAFDHDFSKFVENCHKDRRVIEALGAALAGSNRPLIITSGTGMGSGAPGTPSVENVFNLNHPNPRIASELAGATLLNAGVNVSVVRLPQVHNTFRQGLITPLIAIAREKGFAAYIGDGRNRWPAGHLLDVVRLYRRAIERQESGARYHAVAEEGIATRDIAEVIGQGLNMPVKSVSQEEAAQYFGWMAMFASLDFPASSALTQAKLDWHPTGPSLIEDLKAMQY